MQRTAFVFELSGSFWLVLFWAFESIIWWEQALNLRCALKLHIDSGNFSDAYHLVVLQEGDKYERGDIIYWQMSKYGIAAVRVIGLMFFSAF